MTTQAKRQPARPTHDRVAELVRAGLTDQAAINQVAEVEGRPPRTVASAYYKVRGKLHPETRRPHKANRPAGKAPETAPKPSPRVEGNGTPTSALEAVEAAQAAIERLKAVVYQLEADAALGRAVKAAMTPPDADA